MAILTPSLVKLRSGFDKVAPGRDKASDGWIGDQAHASGTSGHNPDESGRAERQDSDRVDEVRAVDVDKDLRAPGLTMQRCIQKILATPRDRKRLIYIIWNRTIWSASNGWKPRAYTGSNPHTQHGHLSGHPSYDNDTAPWGIEELTDDMPTTPTQFLAILKDPRVAAEMRKLPWQYQDAGQPSAHGIVFGEMRANLKTLLGKDWADEQEIIDGVLGGLGSKDLDDVATALRAAFGDRAAELGAKLTAG